jgi:aspartyl-tRNA(Asn)/glutamyl-tRNA(Gln) amidotransferase subunit C
MKKDDVKKLAELSRLELNDAELEKYAGQFDEILHYVDKIKVFSSQFSVVSDDLKVENTSVKNVFRSDEDIQEGGIFTDKILKEAPASQDGFVKVKKILNYD